VGDNSRQNNLARVCVVNSKGQSLYSRFVIPAEAVTDYRCVTLHVEVCVAACGEVCVAACGTFSGAVCGVVLVRDPYLTCHRRKVCCSACCSVWCSVGALFVTVCVAVSIRDPSHPRHRV